MKDNPIHHALQHLADRDRIRETMVRGGLCDEAGTSKASMFHRCAAALIERGISPQVDASAWYVPGRIEVLGKHTDYAGGRSMVAAPERGLCMVASPRADHQVHLIHLAGDCSAVFDCCSTMTPRVGHWSHYPMTAARRMVQNFPAAVRGADVAFLSDLPVAAGMSSSSALIVAFFLVMADLNRLDRTNTWKSCLPTRQALASYLGCVENGQCYGDLAGDRGVGTFGGSEDHVAMLCSEPGRVMQYAYCPVHLEQVIDFPHDHVFAIASSGIVAQKTGSAMAPYNRLSRLAGAIVELWRERTGHEAMNLHDAVTSSPDAPDRLRRILSKAAHPEFSAEQLTARLEHFLCENEQIIPAASDALRAGELDAFAPLVDRSQKHAEQWLGNQVRETVFLAASAGKLGATAASAFGAGFGGSVWAMIPSDQAEVFCERWRNAYARQHPEPAQRAEFFITRPGPAALRITPAQSNRT